MTRVRAAEIAAIDGGRLAVRAAPRIPNLRHPHRDDDLIGEEVVRLVLALDGHGNPTNGDHIWGDIAVSNAYIHGDWVVVNITTPAAYWTAVATGAPLPTGTPIPVHLLWVTDDTPTRA